MNDELTKAYERCKDILDLPPESIDFDEMPVECAKDLWLLARTHAPGPSRVRSTDHGANEMKTIEERANAYAKRETTSGHEDELFYARKRAYITAALETARADAEICVERIKLMNVLGCDAGNKQTLTHAEIQYEHLMEAAKIKQLILAAAGIERE